VCARALGDTSGATALRASIARPYSAEVEAILSTVRLPGRPEAIASERGSLHRRAPPETEAASYPRWSRSFRAASPGAGCRSCPRVLGGAGCGQQRRAMGRVTRITIHHTGGPDYWGTTSSDAATEIRNIQKYHQTERGWADIGYHYVVDRAGNVWQGRRLRYQGAHARGSLNRGNIGIVVLGNFCTQRPTPAQCRSLTLLTGKLCDHFGISTRQVYTHGEIACGKTSCPGRAFPVSFRRCARISRGGSYRLFCRRPVLAETSTMRSQTSG